MSVVDLEQRRRTEIDTQIERISRRLIEIRRDLHTHPEVGHKEYRTTGLIVDELERNGLIAKILPVGTGAYCDVLPNGFDWSDGLIGLRADIDALPITDRKDVPWRSQNPGVCHACGHDVHTTILLGVGMVLAQLRDADLLPRAVRLIFQPAEETSPGGALDAIDGGVLQDVTEVYALHCDPRTDVGKLALKVGPITSAVDQLDIRLTGSGGHTSRPHLTQDIVGALGALATTMQLVLSRRVDPRSGVSLMWGSIHAGSVANAIPGEGHIVGTLRALDVSGWKKAKQLIPVLARQVVRAVRGRGRGRRDRRRAAGGQPRPRRTPARRCHQPGHRSGGGRRDRAVAGRRGLLVDAPTGSRRAGPARRTHSRPVLPRHPPADLRGRRGLHRHRPAGAHRAGHHPLTGRSRANRSPRLDPVMAGYG